MRQWAKNLVKAWVARGYVKNTNRNYCLSNRMNGNHEGAKN